MSHRTTTTDPNVDTLYQLLGVDFRATPAEITRAYRKLMKECHPDRQPPSQRERTEVLCKNLNQAYATLKDPIKRRQYDQSIRTQELQDQIMNRYVGGLGGPGLTGHDPHAGHLRRERTEFEKAELRQADRTAIFSLLRAFVLITVVGIVLLLVFAVLSALAGLVL